MKQRFVSMGPVLLVTALLVTLLLSFSLLSLSAARGDLSRAQALAQSSRDYYAACSEAETVRAALIRGEDPGTALTAQNGTVTFRIPMDEGRSLQVTLREGSWEILGWQTLAEPHP